MTLDKVLPFERVAQQEEISIKVMAILEELLTENNLTRLAELKEFYSLVEEKDVVTLALRVLEMGQKYDSPIFYFQDDEFYEITIG